MPSKVMPYLLSLAAPLMDSLIVQCTIEFYRKVRLMKNIPIPIWFTIFNFKTHAKRRDYKVKKLK